MLITITVDKVTITIDSETGGMTFPTRDSGETIEITSRTPSALVVPELTRKTLVSPPPKTPAASKPKPADLGEEFWAQYKDNNE